MMGKCIIRFLCVFYFILMKLFSLFKVCMYYIIARVHNIYNELLITVDIKNQGSVRFKKLEGPGL